MDGALTWPDRLYARAQGAVLRCLLALPRVLIRLLAGRPVIRDGQRLDVEPQLALRLDALSRPPALDTLTPERGRRQVARQALAVEGRKPALGVQAISLPGVAGPIGGRLYIAEGTESPGPLLVYFHGGGFVVGDLDSHDHPCRFLAVQAGVRVLAVDYRRAPEHRFPAAADDAWAGFRFAAEHAGELGADPHRLAVAGDSAGGNLAAGVAQRAAREGGPGPVIQLLLYPWLDLSRKRESYRLFSEGFYLSERDLDWYAGHYLGPGGDAADPRCSPLLAPAVEGLAPAYIATAGFDPLRDEAEEYAARLRSAGVLVAMQRHRGEIHGFANWVGSGRAGREAMLQAAGALRLALAAG